MESLRKSLGLIGAQLREMNLSQRLAIMLGAVLVAGSLAWLTQWAAQPSMSPLLEQDLSAEELARIRTGLVEMNLVEGSDFRIEGTRVLTRSNLSTPALRASLQQRELLPEDLSASFEQLVRESNPWISQEENKRRWVVALQTELERHIQTFNGVKGARVFLNLDSKVRLVERTPTRASAGVTIEMRGREPVPRNLARSVAGLVAGAVTGLTPERVHVVDSLGATAWPTGELADGGMTVLRREQMQREEALTHKIAMHLPDPMARVSVNVILNSTTRRATSDEPTTAVEANIETSSLSSTNARLSGEPGARPNLGTTAGGAPLGDNTQESTSRTELAVGRRTLEESTPAGDAEQVFAAVSLSDIYLANLYMRRNPDAETPTFEELEETFTDLKEDVTKQVLMLVRTTEAVTADQVVDVTWHIDIEPTTEVVAASTMDSALGLAGRYAPQAALTLLAFVALGFMMKLARRPSEGEAFGLELGLPQEAIDAARRAAEDVQDFADQANMRPAAEGTRLPATETTDGVLEAHEVDEETVAVNKMVDQVSEYLQKDPQVVANVFERWMQSKE